MITVIVKYRYTFSGAVCAYPVITYSPGELTSEEVQARVDYFMGHQCATLLSVRSLDDGISRAQADQDYRAIKRAEYRRCGGGI